MRGGSGYYQRRVFGALLVAAVFGGLRLIGVHL